MAFHRASPEYLVQVRVNACRILRNICLILRIAAWLYAQDARDVG